MARERGGDPNQIDRPESTSTLSHPVGDENGPQSAQASDEAARRAVNGHPDQEIQTGAHQPATAQESRDIVDHEVSEQTDGESNETDPDVRDEDGVRKGRETADDESEKSDRQH